MVKTKQAVTEVDVEPKPETDPKQKPGTVRFSTGVVLNVKRVSATILEGVVSRGNVPKVPMQMIEDKGREEPNESDPEYQKALRDYYRDVGQRYTDALIMFGTTVKTIPIGMQHPDQEDWSEQLAVVFGEPLPERGFKRHLAWVRYVAMATAQDVVVLQKAVEETNATREEAVAEAMVAFQGEPQRLAIVGAPAEPNGPNRAQLRHANRQRSKRI